MSNDSTPHMVPATINHPDIWDGWGPKHNIAKVLR